jgi:hypothetical protein
MRPTSPSSGHQDSGDGGSQSTRVEHLLDSRPDGEVALLGALDVAVQVGPVVRRCLVPQPPVQLDDRPELPVFHIAVRRPTTPADSTLASACRQAVPSFDVAKVEPLEN